MSYQGVILARSPLAYWPLEGETSSAVDATGHGYAGTPTLPLSSGSAPFVTSGPSTYFTGGAARVFISASDPSWPMSRMPAAGQPFSAEYWVRSVSLSAQEFNLWHKTGTNVVACYGPVSGGAIVALSGITPHWRSLVAVDSRPRDQWHYIVATFDGTTYHMYVNCVLAATGGFTTSSSATVSSDGLWFGQQVSADFEVAHVALYDYPLTAADVAASCRATRPDVIRLVHADGADLVRLRHHTGAGTVRVVHHD